MSTEQTSTSVPVTGQPQMTQYPAQPQAASQNQYRRVPAGCKMAALGRVFSSTEGVLRTAELICAVISFATMGTASGLNASTTAFTSYIVNFSHFSEFGFLVASGVLVFLWCLAQLIFYLYDFPGKSSRFRTLEMVGDFVLFVFEFSAALSSAVRCSAQACTQYFAVCQSTTATCSGNTKAQAGVVFAFFLFFLLLISFIISFRQWRGRK